MVNKKIVINTGWIAMGKLLHAALSFVVGLITARYLGPSNYGIIGYASAYVSFVYSFCTLGFPGPVLKELIDKPCEQGQTIGSAICFRLLSSFISIIVICLVVSVVNKGDLETVLVVLIYSVCVIFQCFDTFQIWFQSKLLSKYYSISTFISLLVSSLYKIYILITKKNIFWFAAITAIDYCVLAMILITFYKICKGPKLSFSYHKGKELLKTSVSYVLSGLMISIYSSTDKLMLEWLMGNSEVGYYSLAISLGGACGFVLTAIIDSINPSIMEYYKYDNEMFVKQNKKLYSLVFYISIAISVLLYYMAPYIINVLYGKAYEPTIQPLKIIVWYICFSYLGVARDSWIMCNDLQKYLKYIYLGSAVTNILLNCILIPNYGAIGAAIASLITQLSTVFVFPFFIKDMRINVKYMLESIFFK